MKSCFGRYTCYASIHQWMNTELLRVVESRTYVNETFIGRYCWVFSLKQINNITNRRFVRILPSHQRKQNWVCWAKLSKQEKLGLQEHIQVAQIRKTWFARMRPSNQSKQSKKMIGWNLICACETRVSLSYDAMLVRAKSRMPKKRAMCFHVRECILTLFAHFLLLLKMCFSTSLLVL